MTKKELRKLYLAKRAELTTDELRLFSVEIGNRILDSIDFTEIKAVHIFLSSSRHAEIDTFLIMKMIREIYPEIDFVVPKSNYETNTFLNLKYDLDDELVFDAYGIPEPKSILEVEMDKIDLVFMPLICCDKNGHRVGYGKGFYDRFLEYLPEKVNRVGLSFFNPCELITDVGSHDKPLSSCVTPNSYDRFD